MSHLPLCGGLWGVGRVTEDDLAKGNTVRGGGGVAGNPPFPTRNKVSRGIVNGTEKQLRRLNPAGEKGRPPHPSHMGPRAGNEAPGSPDTASRSCTVPRGPPCASVPLTQVPQPAALCTASPGRPHTRPRPRRPPPATEGGCFPLSIGILHLCFNPR